MENPSRQTLDDIASLIVSVKSQLSLIEEKLAELSAHTEQNEKPAETEDVAAVEPVETSSDGDLFCEKDKTLAAADPVPADDSDTAADDVGSSFHIDAGDLLKEAEHLVYETGYAAEEADMKTGREKSGAEPKLETSAEPELKSVPETGPVENQAEHRAVMDVLAEKEAWKKDRPGMPVKDVRSAISLNDRALFIRSLFREDPLLFSRTLVRINDMDSLEEVEAALRQDFPEWDMESDVVYRFMMCVRRKVG